MRGGSRSCSTSGPTSFSLSVNLGIVSTRLFFAQSMSPILRREHEYDPRKRRAALLDEFAARRREETKHDPPPIPDGNGDVGQGAALMTNKISRDRSYGSDQGSVTSDGSATDPGDTDEPEGPVVPPRPLLKRTIVHLALTLAIQSTPSLLLSLVGLVFTGQLLDHLAVWSVFRRVDELFILVPVLGNLKGNLEMLSFQKDR